MSNTKNMEKTRFLTKFMQITGMDKEKALKAINTEKKSVLVLNTLLANNSFNPKTSAELEQIHGFENVYLVAENKQSFTKSENFKKGEYYIQNLSSLLPVLALNPQPKDKILDLCASPGGKSFNICRLTNNLADLSVNEAEKHRFKNLQEVVSLYGMNVSNFYFGPGQGLFRKTTQKFNKVLVDAPCSAEGLISLVDENTDPPFWNQKKVKQLRNLQKKLVNSAYHMLEDNGTLVYSTCTYSPEENEEVVSWLIDTFSDLKIEEITGFTKRDNFVPALKKWENKVFNDQVAKCIRVLPTQTFEGFFVAKLTKSNK